MVPTFGYLRRPISSIFSIWLSIARREFTHSILSTESVEASSSNSASKCVDSEPPPYHLLSQEQASSDVRTDQTSSTSWNVPYGNHVEWLTERCAATAFVYPVLLVSSQAALCLQVLNVVTLTYFLCFLISQLWGRGVEIRDVVVVVSIVLIQALGGGLLWIVLSARFHMNQAEFFSMGLVIGSILTTFINQLLLVTQLKGLGALVLLVLAVSWIASRKLWNSLRICSNSPDVTLLIFLAALVPLAIDEASTTPATLFICIGALIVTLIRNPKVKTSFVGLVIVLSGLVTRLFLNIFADGGGPLSPLFFTSTDDQIKSEQLAYSISKWGLGTNSAAVNRPIKFHWLSLGWAGDFMQFGDVDPYVVTLHVIPLLVLVCISALLLSIARELNLSQSVTHLVPFFLLAAGNGQVEFRFFFILTTSNLVPHLWILGLVFVLLLYERSHRMVLLLLLPMLSVAVLLGKGPYGVVIVVGLIGSLVYSFRRSPHSCGIDFKYQIAASLAIALTGIAYIYYLRSPLTDSYYFSLPEFVYGFPYPLPGASGSLLFSGIFGTCVLVAFVVTRFAWVLRFTLLLQSRLGWFLTCSAFAGFLSFVVKQARSEIYFLNASLTVSVVALLIALSDPQSTRVQFKSFQLVGLISLLAVLMWIMRTLWYDGRFLIVSSLLIALTLGVTLSRNWNIQCAVTLTLVLSLIPIANGISSLKLKPDKKFELISVDELLTFEWIRHNTPDSAIFITNRSLCENTIRCGSGMPVAASLTRRRFLIEGARTLTPTRMWDGPYPQQLQTEVFLSLEFADSPSESTIESLKQIGVTHALLYGEVTYSQQLPVSSKIFGIQDISVIKL